MNNIPDKLKEELAKSHNIISQGKEVVPRFLVFLPEGEQVYFFQ